MGAAQLAQLVAGLAVVALVVHDAFVTTVSAVTAGGPLTRRLGLGLWRLLRRGARGPRSRLLAAAGPVTVSVILGAWLVGLWGGWTLVFSADAGAVTHTTTGEPADGWSRVYFTGYAVYTLGLGDYAPHGAPWQVLTAVATINGFVLLTMAVSYLVPVVMAVSDRRQQGMLLHGLGDDAQGLLLLGWRDGSFDSLHARLHDLAPAVGELAQKYLSYPVLHFFHSPARSTALEPGLVALDEALLILEHGVDERVRPDPVTLQPLRVTLDRFAELVADEFTGEAAVDPPAPDLGPLRRAGVPTVEPAAFREALAARGQHRRLMAAFVADAHWRFEDCVHPEPAGRDPDA